MTYLSRLVACLFLLLSFNAKALVVNGCAIEAGTSCIGANLTNANLYGAYLAGALYNDQTLLDFDPVAAGMTFVPLPAGIYLFLSGLVGLGLVKSRNV